MPRLVSQRSFSSLSTWFEELEGSVRIAAAISDR
jgi:hypothetical protein